MSEPQTRIEMGQRWAIWVAGRQQWLLASVVKQKNGRATLKFDARYDLGSADGERQIDEQDLLGMSNLFRHIAAS
jgi:hypothetical protein